MWQKNFSTTKLLASPAYSDSQSEQCGTTNGPPTHYCLLVTNLTLCYFWLEHLPIFNIDELFINLNYCVSHKTRHLIWSLSLSVCDWHQCSQSGVTCVSDICTDELPSQRVIMRNTSMTYICSWRINASMRNCNIKVMFSTVCQFADKDLVAVELRQKHHLIGSAVTSRNK